MRNASKKVLSLQQESLCSQYVEAEDPARQRVSPRRSFWKACKDYIYSGMGTQKRKAAPPTEALAEYFASKIRSLTGEEGKEVPTVEQALPGARRLQGFKATRAKILKVLLLMSQQSRSGQMGLALGYYSSAAPRSWAVLSPVPVSEAGEDC
jgi:hypothetical protein